MIDVDSRPDKHECDFTAAPAETIFLVVSYSIALAVLPDALGFVHDTSGQLVKHLPGYPKVCRNILWDCRLEASDLEPPD